MTEWFEQWFGEEYLQLYPHRDDEDAQRMVSLINDRIGVAGRFVLDLACGPGRHAEALAQLDARVIGFDLSMPLLRRARVRMQPPLQLVRGDMRYLPFASRSFDLVVNLFTSFGYFADDRQHRRVLQNVATVLKPQGTFVLDYFNATWVRSTLVPRDERTLGSRRVATERRISADDRFVIKEIQLVDEGHSFLERVRLFAPHALERMLTDAGFSVTARFGGYGAEPLADDAPRAIFVASRS